MSSMARQSIRDYRGVHLEADVAAASPHRLIQLLMQRLLARLGQAGKELQAEHLGAKGELIGDAIAIIDCLRTSLNFDAGAEVAENLERLYDFMIRELLFANMENDAARIAGVSRLVGEIKEAWDGIGESA